MYNRGRMSNGVQEKYPAVIIWATWNLISMTPTSFSVNYCMLSRAQRESKVIIVVAIGAYTIITLGRGAMQHAHHVDLCL